jgi:D-alanyl-D-alanine carboxypeptidase/D-alanyl-D-alanine-endopeptidase (penicillin-binding protein 4)
MSNCLRLAFIASLFLFSCSPARQISKSARKNVLNVDGLKTAHIGISVFDPVNATFLYNYQGDKYFVPASNTKIPTCYAAMKYLGDSLVSARVGVDKDGVMAIYPAGDPTFLHPEFKYQPLFQAIKGYKNLIWDITGWKSDPWGSGWSWNDYDAAYMAERSPLPVYGNLISFSLSNENLLTLPHVPFSQNITIEADSSASISRGIKQGKFQVERELGSNGFYIRPSVNKFNRAFIPFRAEPSFVSALLKDTLKAESVNAFSKESGMGNTNHLRTIYSQPTDSLLKPLMHRSDNFFAEQSLQMVSHAVLGVMNDGRITDSIIRSDFKDLPQKPRWADGSGLSRYNLFTPQDFVAILEKMKNEFGMERIKAIFPTGNEGTLTNYYVTDSSFIYAKTGTLSGVVALSGFLYTKKNKLLIFSVLVNNHQTTATTVRRAVEKFVKELRERY